jgi:predicted metal-binding membrane protein
LTVLAGTQPGALAGRGVDWLTAICGGIGLPFSAALPGAITMWVLMSIAMMLPTAAPAIDIYVRLTRRVEARRATHIAGFAGGYLIAWSALAVAAGAAQAAVGSGLAAQAALVPAGYLSGGILLLAGLYQITPVKQACLTLCRNPMAFFMSHWREDIGGALRMGLHHGAICIGCCWALMGLMFLSGAMNLAWMAGLGLLMLLEKAAPGAGRAGQLAGLAMALAGAALIATEFV